MFTIYIIYESSLRLIYKGSFLLKNVSTSVALTLKTGLIQRPKVRVKKKLSLLSLASDIHETLCTTDRHQSLTYKVKSASLKVFSTFALPKDTPATTGFR